MRPASLTWASVTTKTWRERSAWLRRLRASACSSATPKLVPPLSRFLSKYLAAASSLASVAGWGWRANHLVVLWKRPRSKRSCGRRLPKKLLTVQSDAAHLAPCIEPE